MEPPAFGSTGAPKGQSHPWCGWLASEQQGSCRSGVLPSLSQNTAAQAPRAGPAEAIHSFHFLRLPTSGPSELPSVTCIICKASGVPCNPKVLRQTDNTECLAVIPGHAVDTAGFPRCHSKEETCTHAEASCFLHAAWIFVVYIKVSV